MRDDLIPSQPASNLDGGADAASGEDFGADRLHLSRRALIVTSGVVVAALIAGAVVFGGTDPKAAPRPLARGGDLGEVSDPMALSEQLAPELTPEAGVGGEPVDRPACADSDQALPEDGASLIYTAKLTWEGTPAVVLGYRVKGDNLQRLLLVMAESDCRLLVTQSF